MNGKRIALAMRQPAILPVVWICSRPRCSRDSRNERCYKDYWQRPSREGGMSDALHRIHQEQAGIRDRCRHHRKIAQMMERGRKAARVEDHRLLRSAEQQYSGRNGVRVVQSRRHPRDDRVLARRLVRSSSGGRHGASLPRPGHGRLVARGQTPRSRDSRYAPQHGHRVSREVNPLLE